MLAAAAAAQRRRILSQGTIAQRANATRNATPQQRSAAMDEPESQQWTLAVVLRVGLLFLLAGLTEIGGGWLVWQALREGKPWWWAVCGSAVLVLYGFVPCLQPLSDFGRLYAVYGGVFIALAYGYGWLVENKADMAGQPEHICQLG